jgi:hypothetical protein
MTLIPVGERSLQLQKSMSDKIHRVNQRKWMMVDYQE